MNMPDCAPNPVLGLIIKIGTEGVLNIEELFNAILRDDVYGGYPSQRFWGYGDREDV